MIHISETWSPWVAFNCKKCGELAQRLYEEVRDKCIKCGGRRCKAARKNKQNEFLKSKEWKAVRKEALSKYGKTCAYCGSQKSIQVDHIKPKSKFPELALDINNLQILCWPCNKKKGASVCLV